MSHIEFEKNEYWIHTILKNANWNTQNITGRRTTLKRVINKLEANFLQLNTSFYKVLRRRRRIRKLLSEPNVYPKLQHDCISPTGRKGDYQICILQIRTINLNKSFLKIRMLQNADVVR